MARLNICIDIDGTITESYFWLYKAAEHFGKKINIDDFRKYEFFKALGINNEEYNEFYEKYKFEYHPQDILKKDAKSIINELYKENNIYFVTARDKSLEKITADYLDKNLIPHNGLYVLGSHYKVEKARELNCDVFIEDNPTNTQQLSEAGFTVLLMDATYNRDLKGENIIRVYNWNDIENQLNTIKYSEKAI